MVSFSYWTQSKNPNIASEYEWEVSILIDNWPCSIDTYWYFIISILPITNWWPFWRVWLVKRWKLLTHRRLLKRSNLSEQIIHVPSVMNTLKRNLSREKIRNAISNSTTFTSPGNCSVDVNVFDTSGQPEKEISTERLKRVSSSSSLSSNSKHFIIRSYVYRILFEYRGRSMLHILAMERPCFYDIAYWKE